MFISQLLGASGKVNGSKLPGKWCTGLTSARAGFFIVFSPQRGESYQLHPVCWLGWKRGFFKLLHVSRIKWVPVSLLVVLIQRVHDALGALVPASAEPLCRLKHTKSHQSSWVWSPAKSQAALSSIHAQHSQVEIPGRAWKEYTAWKVM